MDPGTPTSPPALSFVLGGAGALAVAPGDGVGVGGVVVIVSGALARGRTGAASTAFAVDVAPVVST